MSNATQEWVQNFKSQLVVNIEDIELPRELTCAICLMVFPLHEFANAQLNLVRATIIRLGPEVLLSKHLVKCYSCSHKANVERKCRMCRKWKDSELFARVQRNLESPLCMRCQDWIQQEEWKEKNPSRKAFAAIEDRDGSVPAKEESQLAHPCPAQSSKEVDALKANPGPIANSAHTSTEVGFYVPVAESSSEEEEEEEEDTPALETSDYL